MTCLAAVRASEKSWMVVESKMKACSRRIVDAVARSKEELDFIVSKLPVIDYILTATVMVAADVSGVGGDSAPPKPKVSKVSRTPFIDAGKLFVEQLVGPPVPCSTCVLERLYHRGAITHLRTPEAVCSHVEQLPSMIFEQVQREYAESYPAECMTELQQCSQAVLSHLTIYSQHVFLYRESRAALDAVMLLFADYVTAVALRSSEELDFIMARVPFVGWLVDSAGRMRHGHELEVPILEEQWTSPDRFPPPGWLQFLNSELDALSKDR
ncbi:hypothetical protein VKT23_019114 [Stygiomarasmius scandens]|uniref:Uncharacterized protein n=1 Tax=Marasmiellus scandens TaxID=2682957 RepID=A0ABR1IQS7_9AGAR